MHYKIVGVSDASPDQLEVYRGEFTPVPAEDLNAGDSEYMMRVGNTTFHIRVGDRRQV